MIFHKNIFGKPIAKSGNLWYNSSVVNSNADVAQLVEQLIRNQQVAGSSPAISSKEGMPFIRYSFFFIFLKKTAAVLCDCRCLFNLFLLIKSVNI